MKPGRFDFRCSMGMYSGTLMAVEGPAAEDAAAVAG
jgi:hypothetical protein